MTRRSFRIRKDKPVNFTVVAEKDGKQVPEPYQLLKQMRKENHADISEARIALAWRHRVKSDKDGILKLGQCVKNTGVHRELADYDFIIVLNKSAWDGFTKDQKLALLDHELCHIMPSEDKNGNGQQDDRGRKLFRTRRHDIEEFSDVVRRHGLYKKDLEKLAEIMTRKTAQPLFAEHLNSPAAVTQ
jgi:hypothetical protein